MPVSFCLLPPLPSQTHITANVYIQNRVTMSHIVDQNDALSLERTNCSAKTEDSQPVERPRLHKGKKRIGRYSFHLRDQIGSGCSSRVYRGIRDDQKGTSFAIKAISLRNAPAAQLRLLENQVHILQQLDHPHILRFVDLHYTNNHCYLITEFCEGGTLEQWAKRGGDLPWGEVVRQVGEGCAYLAKMRVLHRDIKPANIFLKDGVWKIGDFGFARVLPEGEGQVKESYRVGSPIFMPLESLQRNVYSLKSDAYALGVSIYHLILEEYPWNGSNLHKLVKNCKQKNIDWHKLDLLPQNVLNILKGLCCKQADQRLTADQCDWSAMSQVKPLREMEICLQKVSGMREQVILCQFINYLMKNSMLFLEDTHVLYSLMSDHLYHLTALFQWENNTSLRAMKQNYILADSPPQITHQLYRKISHALLITIHQLKQSSSPLCRIGLQKFLEFYQIIQSILTANSSRLVELLSTLRLHMNFQGLLANNHRIQQLMALLP